uniref:hypothetical protein n=1 Tax=Gemmiger formicilis TaxID=745368 RepID=UPI004024CBE6
KSDFMELSGLDSTSAEVYAGLITVCADEMEKAVDQERMVLPETAVRRGRACPARILAIAAPLFFAS